MFTGSADSSDKLDLRSCQRSNASRRGRIQMLKARLRVAAFTIV
jgi:hypothetical protein